MNYTIKHYIIQYADDNITIFFTKKDCVYKKAIIEVLNFKKAKKSLCKNKIYLTKLLCNDIIVRSAAKNILIAVA